MFPMKFKEGRQVNYEVQFNPLLIKATQKDNPQKCWQLNLTKQNYLQKLPSLKKTTSFEILEKTIAEMFEGKVCSTFVEDTGLDYLRVVCDSDLIRNLFGEIKLDLKSNDLLRDASPRAGITSPRGISSQDRRSLALDSNRYSQNWGVSPRHSLALEREPMSRDTFSTPRSGFDQNWESSTRAGIPSDRQSVSLDRSNLAQDTFSTPMSGLDQNWGSSLDRRDISKDWDTTSKGSINLDREKSPGITTDKPNVGMDWESMPKSGIESDKDLSISEDEEYEMEENRQEEAESRDIWEVRNRMQKLENENEDLRRMVLSMRKGSEFDDKLEPQAITTRTTISSYPKLTIFFFLFFGIIAAAYLVAKLM